ncbi:uncharacterized protein F5891DRAFT_1186518 [Suillus fuscotomentosus]|uniref:DUF6532 domain-containing protein n=1 Tax=Suillus fuscotomentosus TaxID=1912939 RepID=A0AAD4EA58_9AGAM|nr:uncharacterized protein F5891DRAFT_1186518 [Suillus fuscotomentosus]KAG1902407.1 hypothetical protein F5891DRAFT_1186518 [Suillus fuscotomentosus]
MRKIEVLMVHAPLPFMPPPSPPTDFWSLHDMQPHRGSTISFNFLNDTQSDPNQGLFDFIDQPEASHHGPFDSIDPQASQAYPSSSSSYRGSALFCGVSGDQDTIDFDGLAFGTFLEESGANTSGTSTSHAGTTAPTLIPRSVEIDTLYPLPPPRALQGTVERTQHSCWIPAPYPLPEPKVMPLSTTTTSTPQTLQHATSVDVPVTLTIIAPTDLTAPIVPVTPIVISIDPAPQQLSAPVSIWVSADVQKQIMQTAKTRLIQYLLTLHAMAGSDVQKREVIDLAIAESIPLMNGMNIRVSNPTTSSQRQQLIGTWTSIFSSLIKVVRTCLPFAFNIYPPVDSNILPDEFRRRVINTLINDPTQPLAFMHRFTVNTAGDVTILDRVLDQPFILQMLIHFVWRSGTGLSEFIEDPLEEFNYLFAAIGAIAKLILFEQLSHPPVVIVHTQLEASEMFNVIFAYIHSLRGAQKGPSKVRMLVAINQSRLADSMPSDITSGQSIRPAKKRAMENAVWRTDMRQKRQHPLITQQRAKKACNSLASKGVRHSAISRASKRKESDEGSMGIGRHGPPQKKVATQLDTDAETDDDLEEPESVIKFLSAEIPKFVSTSEAERRDFLLTQPTWPRTFESAPKLTQKTESFLSKSTMATKLRQTAEPSPMASRSRQTAEPFPFSLAQPKAPMASRAKAQSVHDPKRENKTPVWVDHSNDVEELEAASNDYADPKSPNNNILVLDDDDDDDDDHHGYSQGPKLVRSTKAGKLKLTDQDDSTQRVVQRAILEAKVHMTFINGYPDITKKNQFTRDALLTAARTCGVTPIYDRLTTNESYASALASLVDARVPLFCTELKDDACAQVTVYYHLGPDCVDAAKALLASHTYHYAQRFDEEKNPVLQVTKYLMKGHYFNGSKSVGVKFADCFKEIAGNKAQWPEVTIPMVALTSTLVYAALLWKSNKSPSKFNFTGNQFSEVYTFHVNFLNKMEENAPSKFHKLMADIFLAVQKLCSNGAAAIVSHKDAMAFLDLDGMDDDE